MDLDNIEVFYRTEAENHTDEWYDADGETMPAGWYYWYCFPGCLPEGDGIPNGPFDTYAEAMADAAYEYGDDDLPDDESEEP